MRYSVLVCAITLAIAPAAHADGTGVIAISASQTDRGAVADAMVAAIAEQHPPRIVPDAVAQARGAIFGGAVPIEELERFRRTRDLIDEGWRAYLRASFDFAQARLAAARIEAEAIVALPGGAELYADASLRLGIVLGALGNTAASQSALALALALDPERPITLAEFSPDVVGAVGAVRALARPTRDVAIAVDPAGATVAVDGKDVGAAPLHAQLAVGQHVIVARAPGFRARAQAMAVASAGATDMRLALDPDVAFARLDGGARVGMPDPTAQELVDAAIQFAELDEVVVVADTDHMGGEALLLQRCAGLPARCTAIAEVGYGDRAGLPAAARSAWQEVRAADLRYAPSVLDDPRVAGEKIVHHCSLCRSPWLWGGVGVAVVAGAIATIAIVSASRPAPIVSTNPGGFTTH